MFICLNFFLPGERERKEVESRASAVCSANEADKPLRDGHFFVAFRVLNFCFNYQTTNQRGSSSSLIFIIFLSLPV